MKDNLSSIISRKEDEEEKESASTAEKILLMVLEDALNDDLRREFCLLIGCPWEDYTTLKALNKITLRIYNENRNRPLKLAETVNELAQIFHNATEEVTYGTKHEHKKDC